jgi:hypothetical protein
MSSQAVHQRRANLSWIPMLVAALVVVAIALSLQLALRDRGATVVPQVTTADQITEQGASRMVNHANDIQARQGPVILPHESRPGFGQWPPSVKAAGQDEGWKLSLPPRSG